MANNPLIPIGSESSTADESIRLARLGHDYVEDGFSLFRAFYEKKAA